MITMFQRTGVRGFAFFSRGNPDDSALPHCIDSADALDFCVQVLGVSAEDVMRKFEQWCCVQDSGGCLCSNGALRETYTQKRAT